jgi:hypothetical protein
MEINDQAVVLPLQELIPSHTRRLQEKIISLHDLVSDNEIFLCACIHLCISIQDIANNKLVDPSSIVMSRYRQKKKLGCQG